MKSASRCSSVRVSRLYPSEPRLASLLTVCWWRRRGVEDRVEDRGGNQPLYSHNKTHLAYHIAPLQSQQPLNTLYSSSSMIGMYLPPSVAVRLQSAVMKLKRDIVKCGIGMGYCKNLQYWNEAQYKLSVVLEWDTVKDCGIGMGHIKRLVLEWDTLKDFGIGLDSLALAQAGRGM